MKRSWSRSFWVARVFCAVVLLVGVVAATPASASGRGFVTRDGSELRLDGRPFRFAGTNNYYLMYSSQLMVDDFFARAQAAKFTVVRTWGFLEGTANGVNFQSFDGTAPVYNDGPDGLGRLDYVIWKAGQVGIKLVIPMTNNWSDFGGIDQYVRWRGLTHHDDFYTDPTIQTWYRDWISHLLNHVNPRTGLAYKDDPTIMTWELGNEPRCKGSGAFPPSASCTTATLTTWADTMSRHVKRVDRRHLVSVGDEGFLCTDPGGSDWTNNCGEGVDTVAFAKLPAIDVLSFHLYPDGWGKDAAWGTGWITQHVRDARRVHKAVMLGEYGLKDKATRNTVYKGWTDAFIAAGGNGALYWILSGSQDDGTLYPDYDGFTVYCPSPVCQTITNAEVRITTGRRYFPPVADDDTAVVEFGTAATLTPASNDVAYLTDVRPGTIDLDPATAGRQTSLTVAGGRFVLDGATVTFTPAEGFAGKATASYQVSDGFGRLSNVAGLVVTVKPSPTAPVPIASFESGTDGWVPGNWQPDAGSTSQQADYVTDGAHGLRVLSTSGAWFGAGFATPLDLAAKSSIKYDLKTGAAGTSTSIALQVGPGYTWCQSGWGWVEPSSTTTVTIDLTSGFSCELSTLSDVRGIFVWFSAGTFDVDHVRAE